MWYSNWQSRASSVHQNDIPGGKYLFSSFFLTLCKQSYHSPASSYTSSTTMWPCYGGTPSLAWWFLENVNALRLKIPNDHYRWRKPAICMVDHAENISSLSSPLHSNHESTHVTRQPTSSVHPFSRSFRQANVTSQVQPNVLPYL